MDIKKNPLGILFFGGILFFMLFTFLTENDSNKPNTQPSGSTSGSNRSIGTSGLIPQGAWPPVAEGNVFMASDPLATNYYVILDASGSMDSAVSGARKMDSAKTALKSFATSLPAEANLGLSTFSPAQEIIPLGTGNRSEFLKAVERLNPNGGTPLVQSIKKGYESLTDQARQQSGYGRYILLIVTDGQSSDGDPAAIARDIVQQSAIEVQTIGFGLRNHALNINGVTEYYTANSVETLVGALKEVLASETESFVDPTSFSN